MTQATATRQETFDIYKNGQWHWRRNFSSGFAYSSQATYATAVEAQAAAASIAPCFGGTLVVSAEEAAQMDINSEHDRLTKAHQAALRKMMELRGCEGFTEACRAETATRNALSNFQAQHFAPAASTAQTIVNYITSDRSEWQRRMAY